MKGLIVASHYFSLPDHRGGLLSATARYYRLDGTEVTFQDVPLSKIVKEVEAHIKRHVPEGTRTRVYHEVLAGVSGHKETPEWDEAPVNPNEKPSTPFSVSGRVSVTSASVILAICHRSNSYCNDRSPILRNPAKTS
jgi:hypothetical protein